MEEGRTFELTNPTDKPIEPQAKKCGCGRSESGLCNGSHSIPTELWDIKQQAKQIINESIKIN